MIGLLLLIPMAALAAPLQDFLGDVDQFRNNDRALSAEAEAVKSAGTDLLSKQLFWTPSLSAGLNRTSGASRIHVISEEDGKFVSVNNSEKGKSFYLRGDLNLFRGGSDYFALLSAGAQKDAQSFSHLNMASQIEVKAAEIVFRRLHFQAVLRANRQQQDLKEKALRIAEARYRQGRISQEELSRLEIDFSQQENRTRQLDLENIDLEQRLKASFVQKIATESWPLAGAGRKQLALGAKSSDSQRLYWAAQARKFSWRSSQLKQLPTLDLALTYERTNPPESPGKFGGYWGRNSVWSTVISLNFPIWNQLSGVSEVSAQYAAYQQAEAAFEMAEADDAAKREAAGKKIPLLDEMVRETEKILARGERLYESSLKAFRAGRLSTYDLFQEQTRIIETKIELSQNQLSLHQAIVEACALGGRKLRECLSPAPIGGR